MTRRTPPAVQLARDVLHYQRCKTPSDGSGCEQCARYLHTSTVDDHLTLARALLRAHKERT